jgi:hypothetical protein
MSFGDFSFAQSSLFSSTKFLVGPRLQFVALFDVPRCPRSLFFDRQLVAQL